ncbi:TetR family transcriptional regulator [Noviherbaspirillum aerium]|uniref:TetR family transcriptional regulator n=1 Tax=Noviherbaspirillum aerium TaxID=2588497 RepID=UPI00124E3D28|nr:TetR family transcriptional regulator [Noviherbaspirillum aerium]
MVRKTKEAALETRHHLLNAAEDVFHRAGYARTTLEAVAAAAGLTRGAIYWHFKDKSDLFNAMCDRVRLPMEELAASGEGPDNDDPLGHLRKICVFFLTQAATDVHLRKVSDILFNKCEFVDPTDPAYIRQQEAFLDGRSHLKKVMQQAVKKGQLADDLDIPLAAITFHGAIDGILRNWLFSKESFRLVEEVERLVDACLDMVRYAASLRKKA